MEGTVKFFNRIKGFGFINGDDGKDYFLHFSEVKDGKYLNEGDRVSFEGEEGERGLKATNVKPLAEGESTEAPAEEEAPEEEASEEAPAEEAPEEEATEEEKEE